MTIKRFLVYAVTGLAAVACGKTSKKSHASETREQADQTSADEAPRESASDPWIYVKLELPSDFAAQFPAADTVASLTGNRLETECRASSLVQGVLTAAVGSGGDGAASHEIETLMFPCVPGAVLKISRQWPLGAPNGATIKLNVFKGSQHGTAYVDFVGEWQGYADGDAMLRSSKEAPLSVEMKADDHRTD